MEGILRTTLNIKQYFFSLTQLTVVNELLIHANNEDKAQYTISKSR